MRRCCEPKFGSPVGLVSTPNPVKVNPQPLLGSEKAPFAGFGFRPFRNHFHRKIVFLEIIFFDFCTRFIEIFRIKYFFGFHPFLKTRWCLAIRYPSPDPLVKRATLAASSKKSAAFNPHCAKNINSRISSRPEIPTFLCRHEISNPLCRQWTQIPPVH